MRHAKSSWKYHDLSDHERPLNKRGRKAAVKVAKELIRLEWRPKNYILVIPKELKRLGAE